jgi:hypothetical protein
MTHPMVRTVPAASDFRWSALTAIEMANGKVPRRIKGWPLRFRPTIHLAVLICCAPLPAKEPVVSAQDKPGGITEIRIVSDTGEPIGYQVDLSKHFAPTTIAATGRIQAWESLRYGGFLCFNTNQFSGQEHCKATDPEIYAPTNLDVAGWVATCRQSGMKYAVLTTRHTSGFLLWDSPTTHFDVASSGNTTDVVSLFAAECRKQGILPGLYYCMWGGEGWKPAPNARAVILAQLHELATRFGEIPYFWIDMLMWRPADLSPQEIYDAIKSRQPNAVVILNQNRQDGMQLRYFPTDVLNGESVLPPEGGHNPWREVGGTRYYLPFEYCRTSQLPTSAAKKKAPGKRVCWFTYGPGKDFSPSVPQDPKQLAEVIQDAYRRGACNVLLSVAPDHTGRIRPGDAAQLKKLAEFLQPSPSGTP